MSQKLEGNYDKLKEFLEKEDDSFGVTVNNVN